MLIFLFLRFKKKFIFILGISLCGLGIGLSFIKINNNNSGTAEGFVLQAKENYLIIYSQFEKLYVYSKNNDYEIGDYIYLEGYKSELSFTRIESSFDFETYLQKKGVNYQFNSTKIVSKFSVPVRMKRIKTNFLSHFNDETQSVVSSVIFGEVGDGELSNLGNKLHLTRLFSVSGIYLYFFYNLFVNLLLIKIKPKYAELIGIGFIGVYCIFTFPRFTPLRYLSLLIIKLVNKHKLNNRLDYFETIAISMLLFLLVDYHLATSTGFILGYFIPVVVYFVNYITSSCKRIKKKIFSITLLMVCFIPFEISFYNEVNFLSYLLVPFLSPLFIFFAIISWICFLGIPLYPVCEFFVTLITNLLGNISKISFSIYFADSNQITLLIYYLLYFFGLYYLSFNFKKALKIIYLSLLGVFVLNSLPIKNFFSSEVNFINVGQGDSTLIRYHNQTILIDTGGNLYTDIANECLIPFFKKKQIYTIDLLITTHDDYDHSGAVEELVKNFKVKKYITESSRFPINYAGINFINYNNYFTSASEDNEKSLVIGFSLVNTSYLIMGDAPISTEKQIIEDYPNLSCDILKIGHHGSSTSTSSDFIEHIKPIEAIVSVGRNYYGHPDSSVLQRLKNKGIKVRRTDKEGTITYFQYG